MRVTERTVWSPAVVAGLLLLAAAPQASADQLNAEGKRGSSTVPSGSCTYGVFGPRGILTVGLAPPTVTGANTNRQTRRERTYVRYRGEKPKRPVGRAPRGAQRLREVASRDGMVREFGEVRAWPGAIEALQRFDRQPDAGTVAGMTLRGDDWRGRTSALPSRSYATPSLIPVKRVRNKA